jgi:hypothetical protein
MSIANQTNFNMASLNGLVDINADTVSSTIIDTDEINTTILFINDVDVGAQIEENAHKLTAIDYTDTPTPTTTISSSLVVEELADFEANVNILGTTNLKNTNITGDTYLIDDADTSKQLKIHWFGAGNGYWFESMNNGAYIYFVVKSVSGNVRAFQFNYNQLYSSIPFFCDNTFSLSNQPLYFGTDACNIVFVADGGPSNGWRFTNALNNFYTNWFSRDTGGNYINTFRLHHSKISSLIDHEFIGNLLVNSTTVTPTQISYLNTLSSNAQTQLNTLNATKLSLTGGTISGNLTVTGTVYNYDFTYLYKDLIFSHSAVKLILTSPSTSLSQTELSYISGATSNIQTQLNGKLSNSADIVVLSSRARCDLVSTTNYRGIAILSASTASQFNPLVSLDDCVVTTRFLNLGNLVLTASSALSLGIKISSTSSTTGSVSTSVGNNRITVNQIDTTIASILNLIDNSNSKGFIFQPFSSLDQTNNFVASGEVLISTQTVDNSSLILTTNNSALSYGIRIFSGSSTSATITTQVASNNVIVNQSSVTVNGPLNISSASTFFNTITSAFNIVMSGVTSTANKIVQNIISSGDVSGQPNVFKYSTIAYNSNSASGISQILLSLVDNFNNNALWFFPNISAGGYNNLCSSGARAIVAGGVINNNSLILTTWSTRTNGIKISSTSSTHAQTEIRAGDSTSIVLNNISGITQSNTASISFTDATSQTTAFTSAKNTKLNNIGTISTSTLIADTLLTSGVILNCGSISLSAGTYTLSLNCGFSIVTSSTTLTYMIMSYSTSPTALTTNSNLNINNSFNTWTVGMQQVLPNQAIVSPTVTTTYYMLLQVSFGTANTVQFLNGLSSFQAIRIA